MNITVLVEFLNSFILNMTQKNLYKETTEEERVAFLNSFILNMTLDRIFEEWVGKDYGCIP